MNAMKIDLTVILRILYIAMVYNSDRDSRTEKLKTTENRKKIILKWLTKINLILRELLPSL